MTERDQEPADATLVAVEPDLAAHVLDLLDTAAVPATGAPGDGGLTVIAVPAAHLERARATLDLVLPGLLAEESGELAADSPPRLSGRLIRRSDWPAGAPEVEVRGAADPSPRLLDGRRAFERALQAGQAESGQPLHDPADDADFVPPEPPPIPRGDVVSRFAWLGVVGGPILMVATALLELPSMVAAAGLAAFVVGFGVLVARMPDRARTDDGWDDGAVL